DRSRGPRHSVEDIVRTQSSDTANAYGLLDRGLIAPGYRADLNPIDYDALHLHAPEMVYDLPTGARRLAQRAQGYRETIVLGTTVFRDGEATGERAGRLIRGPQAAPVCVSPPQRRCNPRRALRRLCRPAASGARYDLSYSDHGLDLLQLEPALAFALRRVAGMQRDALDARRLCADDLEHLEQVALDDRGVPASERPRHPIRGPPNLVLVGDLGGDLDEVEVLAHERRNPCSHGLGRHEAQQELVDTDDVTLGLGHG